MAAWEREDDVQKPGEGDLVHDEGVDDLLGAFPRAGDITTARKKRELRHHQFVLEELIEGEALL